MGWPSCSGGNLHERSLVAGARVQNIWSIAGDSSRADVNQFLLQYFANYNFKSRIYLSTAPIIIANWDADSDSRWTVPFGLGIGKLEGNNISGLSNTAVNKTL